MILKNKHKGEKEKMSMTEEDFIKFKEGDVIQIKKDISILSNARKYRNQTGIIATCVEIVPKIVDRYIICLDTNRKVIWVSRSEIELHYEKDKLERLEDVKKMLSG